MKPPKWKAPLGPKYVNPFLKQVEQRILREREERVNDLTVKAVVEAPAEEEDDGPRP